MEQLQPEIGRKAAKTRGISLEDSRKQREEKTIQLRKIKRQDRTNVVRKMVKQEDEKELTAEEDQWFTKHKLQVLEILPKKAQQLHSPDLKARLEAVVYFRKILAADKNPPLDVVVQNGQIVPALVAFLGVEGQSQMQFEAAWSLTNIACGNEVHVCHMVDHCAVEELVRLATDGKSMKLRDQALWALCNLSANDSACVRMLSQSHFFSGLLSLVGVRSPPVAPFPQHTPHLQPQLTAQGVSQVECPSQPSLAALRFVAFICGNCCRLKVPLNEEFLNIIIFVLADLLHFPDEEVFTDICFSFSTLATIGPNMIKEILRQGVLDRMREFSPVVSPGLTVPDSPTAQLVSLQDTMVLLLCTLLRSEVVLHRAAVLLKFPDFFPLVSRFLEKNERESDGEKRVNSKQEVLVTLQYVFPLDEMYLSQCLQLGFLDFLLVTLANDIYNMKVLAGEFLCDLLSNKKLSLDLNRSQQLLQGLEGLLDPQGSAPLTLLTSLQTLRALLQSGRGSAGDLALSGALRGQVSALLSHPLGEVSALAAQLEACLDARGDEDYMGY